MKKYKYFLGLLAGIIVLIFSGYADAIDWQADFDKAINEASAKSMPVMIDFYAGWCGWCKKMDKDTYANKEVDALSKRFICVKVDGDKSPALKEKYGIKGYPATVFLDSGGNIIKKAVGYTKPKDFLGIMNSAFSAASSSAASSQKTLDLSQLRLEGIVTTKDEPTAIINGKIVRVGDKISSATVMEIKKDQVRVKSGNKEVILEIY